MCSFDIRQPCVYRPFAFARFSNYEEAVEAFTTLDGSDFGGFKLSVCFARSSIVSEDVYKEKSDSDRFRVTVNHSRHTG